MGSGSPVAGLLSQLVGSGPGSGMAVMFLMTSLLGRLVGLWGLLSPSIRKLDLLSKEPEIAVGEPGADGQALI